MPVITSTAKLNQRAALFWTKELAKLDSRMADTALREEAFARIEYEQVRMMPVYHQTNVEHALEDAESGRGRILSQLARKGAAAKKRNPLQELIETLVEKQPTVSLKSLITDLKYAVGGGVVEDVSDGQICFIGHDNETKSVKISGLKHRLTRARKRYQRSDFHRSRQPANETPVL
jgi:hypothetical protein